MAWIVFLKRIIQIFFIILSLLGGALPAFAAKDYNIKNDAESFFFVNGTSGNIGIATTVPVGKLEVYGGSAAPSRIINVNGTFADLAGTRTGLYVDVTANQVGTGGASGSWSEVRTTANAGTYTNLIAGSFSEALHAGNATADYLVGATTLANQYGAGAVTNAYGIYPQVWKGNGTITNAYGLYYQGVPPVNPDTNVGTGVVTNQYGLAINRLTEGASRNISILLDDSAPGALATGNFGIYQESADDLNFFAGNVGIGTSTVPAQLTMFSTGDDLIDSRTNADLTGANAIESRYYVGTPAGNRTTPSDVNNFRFFSGFGGFQEVVAISINTPQTLGGNVIGAVDFKTQGAAGVLAPRMTINDQGVLFPQRVGIGTTAPGMDLQIGVDPSIPAGSSPVAAIKGNLVVDGKVYGDGSYLVNVTAANPTVNSIPKSAGTFLVDSAVYEVGGNVGIGTSAPVNKLDVISAGGNVGIGGNVSTMTIDSSNGGVSNAALKVVFNGASTDMGEASLLAHRNNAWSTLYINGAGSSLNNAIYVEGDKPVVFNGGNVGIGSGLPGQKLDVVGNVRASQVIDSGLTEGRITYAGTAGQLTDNADLVFVGANVGIGSASPLVKLDVGGNIAAGILGSSGRIYFKRSSDQAAIASYGIETGSAEVRATSGDGSSYFTWQTNSGGVTEKMRLSNAGNLGLGTTEPASRLDVVGGAAHILSNPSTANIGYATTPGSLYVQNDLEVDGNVYLGDASADNLTVTGTFNMTGGANYTGPVTISTTHAGAFVVRQQSNGTQIFNVDTQNGNVGIGTTAPLAMLSVGSGAPNLLPGSGSDLYVKGDIEFDGAIYGDGSQLGNIAKLVTGLTPTRVPVASSASTLVDSVIYAVGNNVGINTLSPVAELQLIGNLYLGPLVDPAMAGIGIPNSASLYATGDTGNSITPHDGAGNMLFKTASNTRLSIAYTGNVGVGTTGPVANLHVGTGSPLMTLTAPLGANDALIKGRLEVDNNIYLNGSLGIGTTAPGARLDVRGAVRLGMAGSGGGITLARAWDGAYQGYVGYTGATNDFVIGNAGGGSTIQFQTGSSDERMRIDSTGNIGIGTNAPKARLHIADDTSVPNVMSITGSDLYVKGNIELDGKIYGDGSALTNIPGLVSGLTATRVPVASGSTTLVDSAIYSVGGNVGIGTALPGFALDIRSNVTGDFGFRVTNANANGYADGVFVNDTGLQGWVGIGAANTQAAYKNRMHLMSWTSASGVSLVSMSGDVRFYFEGVDAGHERVRILSNGNVGIGTSTPIAKLAVAGAGTTTSRAFEIDDNLYNPKVVVLDNGNVGLGTTVPVAQLHVGAGAPNIMPVTGSDDVYIAGNLEVDGKIYGDGTALTGVSVIAGLTDNYLTRANGSTAIENSIVYDDGTNIGIGTTIPTGTLDVSPGGVRTAGDLVVDTVNRTVNIGRLSPTAGDNTIYKFRDRLGNIKSRWNNAGAGSIYFGNFNDGYGVRIQRNTVDLDATINGLLEVDSTGMVGPTAVFTGGNVGIGTTAPLANLHVGTGAPSMALLTALGANDALVKGRLEVDNNIYVNGRIGVGTTAPVALLDVRGPIQVGSGPAGAVIHFSRPGDGVVQGHVGYIGGSDEDFYISAAGGGTNLQFWTGANTERMRIDTNGCVGIGTAVPSARLHVGDAGNVPNAMSITGSDLYVKGNIEFDGRIYGDGLALANIPGLVTGLTATRVPVASNSTTLIDSVIYSVGSNIGIGTNLPVARLEVKGGVISSPHSGVGSERFGLGSAATGNYDTAFGNDTTTTGAYSAAFGYNVDVGGNYSLGMGTNVTVNGHDSLVLGEAASIAGGVDRSILLGTDNATASSHVIALGGIIQTTHANTFLVGTGVASTAANQVVIGANNYPKTDVFFGNGVTNAAPSAYTIHGTSGTGTDIAGANLQLAGGQGTGAGAGGAILLQTSAAGSTGAATNALVTRLIVTSEGNVGIGTTTPIAVLHVGGGGTVPNAMPVAGSDDAYIAGNLEVDGKIYGNGSALTNIVGAVSGLTATRVPVASSSTTLVDSGIYYVGINVGIGNAAPTRPLHISSSASDSAALGSNNAILFIDGQLTSVSRQQQGIGSNPYINPPAASTQNYLGLGFTPVSDSAYVAGAKIMGLYGGVYYYGSNTLGAAYGALIKNYAADTSTITSNYSLYIDSPSKAAGASILNNYGLYIDTQSEGTNTNFAIYSEGGLNYFGSNVGIGTINPVGGLHLYGSGVNGAGAMLLIGDSNPPGNYNIVVTERSGDSDVMELHGQNGIDFTTGGTLGAMKMVLTGAGNVGISTTVPPAALAVGVGQPNAMPVAGSDDAYIAGNLEVDGKIYGDGSALTNIPGLVTGLTATRLPKASGSTTLVDSIIYEVSGNIGIGSTVPMGKLDIVNGDIIMSGPDDGALKSMLWKTNDGSALTGAFIRADPGFSSVPMEIGDFGSVQIFIDTNNNDTNRAFSIHNNVATGTTNELFRVQENGSVGIGTVSPGAALDVAGAGSIRLGRIGVNPSIAFARSSDGAYQADISYVNSGNDLVINNAGGSSNVQFWTGSNTERMRINTAGNVGIGTTVPAARLAVVGTGSTTARAFEIDDNLYNPKVVVLDNGNVGIGTTDPNNKFRVVGISQFTPTAAAAGVEIQGEFVTLENSSRIFFKEEETTDLYGFSLIQAGNANPTFDGTLFTLPTNTFSVIAHSNSLTGLPVLTIARATGNVGLGTTVPVAKLHIGNAGTAPGMPITGNDAYIKGNLEVDGRIYGDGSALTGVIGAVSGLTVYSVPRASSSTTLVDSGIYLTASGNIGIGTTAAGSSIVLQKNQNLSTDIQITNTDPGASAKAQFLMWNGTKTATFGVRGTGFSSWGAMDASDAYVWSDDDISILTSNAGSAIKFGTGNGTPTERMRITEAGRVGIGTTIPGTPFEVRGAVDSLLRLRKIGGAWNYIEFYDDTARQGYFGMTFNGADFLFAPTNGNVGIGNGGLSLYVTAGAVSPTPFGGIIAPGNVGIGTSAPVARLEVQGGQSKFGKTVFFSEVDNGNSGTAKTIDWTAGNKQRVTITGNCTFTFTAPGGPSNLILRLVHENSATVYTETWPAAVKWPSGVIPPLTDTANAVDIVSCYYEGTNYNCQAGLAFQ